MLKTGKSITLTGSSMINDQVVVSLNATIPDDTGVANIRQYTNNNELYEANRTEVRQDVRAFQDKVYEIEDQIAAEQETSE